jgi:hypothetical protein
MDWAVTAGAIRVSSATKEIAAFIAMLLSYGLRTGFGSERLPATVGEIRPVFRPRSTIGKCGRPFVH